MRSEITRIRKATESAHREHSASYGPSLRSQRCFREEEGLGPPGVLTGSFFHDGDTTAWSRVGPARGHSAGTLRPGQGLSRAGPLGRAKCSQGGVAKTSRAPGQRLPWAWVAGVGEALTLPYRGSGSQKQPLRLPLSANCTWCLERAHAHSPHRRLRLWTWKAGGLGSDPHSTAYQHRDQEQVTQPL